MGLVKTTEDGWGCVPELGEVVHQIESCQRHVYEIKNCVRTHSTDVLVSELQHYLLEALQLLNDIDKHVEYETVEDEEDESDYDALYDATRGIATEDKDDE